VTKYLGIEKNEYFDHIGNHIEKCSCNIGGENTKPGFFRDEFGVTWDRSGHDKDIGICDTQIPEPEFSGYTFPKPDLEAVHSSVKGFVNNGKDTFKFAKIGMIYFERAWSLAGMENLLEHFLLEQDFVDELFKNILDHNMQIIEAAMEYNVDGFYFGDDYGQQTGMIMSPGTWRQFIKPGLATMFEAVKKRGKTVALHSCGNISDILDDLIEIGLDIYQTVQPEIYDLKELKSRYGKNLSFWGAISTQRLLPFATPDELKTVVKQTVNILSTNGGYIAAPTHQVPDDVPPENIAALVEVLNS